MFCNITELSSSIVLIILVELCFIYISSCDVKHSDIFFFQLDALICFFFLIVMERTFSDSWNKSCRCKDSFLILNLIKSSSSPFSLILLTALLW